MMRAPAGELEAEAKSNPSIVTAADPPRASFGSRLGHLIAGMRPRQWAKNSFLFAPLIFAHELENPRLILLTVAAFFLFSLTASAVYLGNDVLDVENDRRHPVKRHRPIASGNLPLRVASIAAAILAAVALAGGAAISWRLGGVLLVYLLMNVAYSFRLKRIAFVDVGVIAMGFVLRVLAGAFAIGAPPSLWIFVCTFCLALYLGFGKRKHEILVAQGAGHDGTAARKALGGYTLPRLDFALGATGLLAMVGYLVYTLSPSTTERFGYLLAFTVPFPAFGIWRFNRLITRATRASSPTEAIITDPPFLLSGLLGLCAVVTIVYFMANGR